MLDETTTEDVSETEETELYSNPSALGVILAGIAIGFIVSSLAYAAYESIPKTPSGTIKYDINNDGVTDIYDDIIDGVLVMTREDRNSDGRVDIWYDYVLGELDSLEFDDNFDGRIDMWRTNEDRYKFQSERDVDFDGIPDAISFFEDDVLQRTDWQPNGCFIVERREIFLHGVKTEELLDTNKDGEFDIKIRFDPFGNEIDRDAT